MLAWLAHHGIEGVLIIEDHGDRVDVIDTVGHLLEYIESERWDRSSGDNHTRSTVADTTVGSFREPATPSMQVVLQKKYPTPPYNRRLFLEIDFDKHSPAVNLPGHAAEVLANRITGGKTNQRDIAEGLVARGIKLKGDEHA